MQELRKLNLHSLSCKGNDITRHEKYKLFVLKYLLHLVKLDGTFLTCFDFGAKNQVIFIRQNYSQSATKEGKSRFKGEEHHHP